MADNRLGSITSSASTTIQAGDQNRKVKFTMKSKEPLSPGQLKNLIKFFAVTDTDGDSDDDGKPVDVNGKNFVLVTPTPASSASDSDDDSNDSDDDNVISIRASEKGE